MDEALAIGTRVERISNETLTKPAIAVGTLGTIKSQYKHEPAGEPGDEKTTPRWGYMVAWDGREGAVDYSAGSRLRAVSIAAPAA
jgi:hypothetical protein